MKKKIDYRNAFFDQFYKLASKDKNVIFLSADTDADSLVKFRKNYPKQFYNTGVTEQNSVTLAAGLALSGKKVFVYTMVPFITMRCFEQIKIDIDEQDLPVVLIGNSDYPSHGPTHRPLNAQKLVSIFKNIHGYFPRNQFETEKAMLDSYIMKKPAIICIYKDGLPFI